jgi:hypothetical protein
LKIAGKPFNVFAFLTKVFILLIVVLFKNYLIHYEQITFQVKKSDKTTDF